ncbi:MAG: ABC transporter substrate-binding protein [Acidisphaera sp.]|nr:ABC transporter substrate-binding protein [Acidisphaera sp.]
MNCILRAAVALVCLLAASPVRARADEMLAFNYGYPTADHVNIYVAQDLGLFEKAGLKPTFYTFPSGAPLLAALKSGSVDVVTAGLGLAFALGQNIPLKIIYWIANDSTGEGLVVDPKSGMKSFHDIAKAHEIGAASGTCAQVALYVLAQKAGADYRKLNIVNLPAPVFRNALMSGSIDAGIAWAPYSVMLDGSGFPVVSWDTDYTPPGGLCPRTTAVRPAFLAAHPDIGLKLLQVDAMAAEAVAKNPQLAVDALVKRLGLTPEVAKASYERVYLPRPTYAQQLDPASPYSMQSKDGGLAGQLELATKILYDLKSIAAPVPANVIQDAIDPSALQAYTKAQGSSR